MNIVLIITAEKFNFTSTIISYFFLHKGFLVNDESDGAMKYK